MVQFGKRHIWLKILSIGSVMKLGNLSIKFKHLLAKALTDSNEAHTFDKNMVDPDSDRSKIIRQEKKSTFTSEERYKK